MPNAKKHAVAGAVVGGGLNLVWQLLNQLESPDPPKNLSEALSKIDLLQVAAFAGAGAICASLPDILEPADNPNHRAIFHSVCCGGAIAFGAFGKHTEDLEPSDRHALRVAALSYLSHLFLDGETPKGLPLI